MKKLLKIFIHVLYIWTERERRGDGHLGLIGQVNELEIEQVDLKSSDKKTTQNLIREQRVIVTLSCILMVVWIITTCVTSFNIDISNIYQNEHKLEMEYLRVIIFILMVLGDVLTIYMFERINHDVGKILKKYIYINKENVAVLETKNFNLALDFGVKNKSEMKPVSFKTTWSIYMYIASAFNILVTCMMFIFMTY